MKIAVIGAGNIGGTVGERWQAAGHEVVYGLRDPSKKAGARSIDQALAGAGAVLLALPGSAVAGFVREHARGLDGKVLIDATNNFRAASFNAWAEIAPLVPKAKLYRAFNTLGWDVFANPVLDGVQADLFYAGPADGSEVVEQLISDSGLRPIRVGDADQAGTVDGLLKLWVTLAQSRGRRIAFKLISD
ncbi:MAG TPA: NAD(P)-binding domain-containing protein [Candidatus Udaeobacter sp.]|nr:NAD(P)-binding domain-containing protein [Candidatus Udaeobacter sp.]